jgi:hypothetical protein
LVAVALQEEAAYRSASRLGVRAPLSSGSSGSHLRQSHEVAMWEVCDNNTPTRFRRAPTKLVVATEFFRNILVATPEAGHGAMLQ